MTTIILEDSVGATASVEGTAEAIVSSPIHHDKDVDPTLAHAPRRAREQTQQVSILPAAPQIELPARSFSGDRGMQLALKTLYDGIGREDILTQPDALPEPPQLVSNDRPVGRIALLICSVVGVAAGVAWAITWMPDARATLVNLGKDVPWASGRDTTGATQPASRRCRKGDAGNLRARKNQREFARSERTGLADSAAATMTQPPPAQVLCTGTRGGDARAYASTDHGTGLRYQAFGRWMNWRRCFGVADDLIKSGDSLRRGCCSGGVPKPALRAQHSRLPERSPRTCSWHSACRMARPTLHWLVFGMSEPPNSVRPTRRADSSNSQSHRPNKDGRANGQSFLSGGDRGRASSVHPRSMLPLYRRPEAGEPVAISTRAGPHFLARVHYAACDSEMTRRTFAWLGFGGCNVNSTRCPRSRLSKPFGSAVRWANTSRSGIPSIGESARTKPKARSAFQREQVLRGGLQGPCEPRVPLSRPSRRTSPLLGDARRYREVTYPLPLERRPGPVWPSRLFRGRLSHAVICGGGRAGRQASLGPDPSHRGGRLRL